LRERVADIPLLVWHFIAQFSERFNKPIDAVSAEDMSALQRYPWPGNIRELRNVIERAMILARSPRLSIALPASAPQSTSGSSKLVDIERAHIHSVLVNAEWRIRGVGGAAERLGLAPTTLETRMAKLGLVRPGRVA
jgi:DNA-binding NtrC family response regulator